MSPEEVLDSIVEGINTGNLDSLMTLYEDEACFASQPGQLAKSPDTVRQSLRNFIHLKGKLDLKVKRVLQASDLALVTVILLTWLPRLLTFCVVRPMEVGVLL